MFPSLNTYLLSFLNKEPVNISTKTPINTNKIGFSLNIKTLSKIAFNPEPTAVTPNVAKSANVTGYLLKTPRPCLSMWSFTSFVKSSIALSGSDVMWIL